MRKGFKGFMNKVFKVVWSKSKECYVVVPEIAKNNSGKKKVLASVLAGLAVAGAMGGIAPQQAMADADYGNSHVNIWANTHPGFNGENYNVGQNSIVVGYQNQTDYDAGHDGKVAIGARNKASANSAMAMGNRNNATAGAATAIGAGNDATADTTLAVGNKNNANKQNAIAIGAYNNQNWTEGSWQTTPKQAGAYSLAIGNFNDALGSRATAIGSYTTAKGEWATAIGAQTTASGDGDVAIGDTSKTNATGVSHAVAVGWHAETGAANAVAVGPSALASGKNSVSVGTNNNSRVQDTVTMGQDNDAKTMGGIAIGKNNMVDSTNGGTNFGETRDENSQIAIGRDNTATHLDTIAIGRDTHATGSGATVVGARADASGNNAIAIGNSGKNSPRVTASGVNSIAVGMQSQATGEATIAQGAGANAAGNFGIAVGRISKAKANYSQAYGNEATSSTMGSIAMGALAKGGNDNGTASEGGSVAVGNAAWATGNRAIAIGSIRPTEGNLKYPTGVGKDVATGLQGTDYNTQATANQAIAVGSGARTDAQNSITMGTNAKVDATANGYTYQKTNNAGVKETLTLSTDPTPTSGINNRTTYDAGNGIAIGRDSHVTGKTTSAIAIGNSALADDGAVAATVIGAGASSKSVSSVAIGTTANVQGGEGAVAVGSGATVTGNYDNASAFGSGATVNKTNGTALGAGAQTNVRGGVALGASSQADERSGAGESTGFHAANRTREYQGENKGLADNNLQLFHADIAGGDAGMVSVGNDGIKRQITNVASGTSDYDAVNVAQLRNVGVAVTGDTGKSDFLVHDGRLNVLGTGRVSTTAANDGAKDSKITVAFDDTGMVKAGKNVTVDEKTVNGRTTYTINAADAAAKYDFLTNAKANGGNLDGTAKPATVASGTTVNYAAGKNLTVKQEINQSIGEQTYTYSLNSDLGGITSITNNGGPTMHFGGDNISITGGNLDLGDHNITNLKSGGDVTNNAANIGDVTRISKANDLHIAPTAGTNNNVTEYTVDANKKVTLTYQDGNGKTVNGPKAVIDLSGLKTGDMSSFNVKSSATEGKVAQGSAGVQEIRDGKTVEMQAGKNMTIKQTNNNGNAAVEFALNKDIDLTPDGSIKIGDTNITDNGLTINNGPSITKTGINAGDLNITNVKAGVNDNDAVNVSQLKKVRADERHIKPGEYAVDANGKVTMTYLDGNNKDVANETAVITGIAKQDLSNINKGGETVIQNLAKKSIDMENGKNTKVSNREINGVKTFKVDVEGDLTDITSITNKDGDGKVVFGGNQTVNVAGDHNINLNAKVGDITGLTNVTLDAPDFAKKGRAATEEQLNIVNNKFNNTVGLTGNTGATELQKLNKQGGLSFGVVGANNGEYIKTTASGSNVVADLSDSAKNKLNSTVVVEGKNAARVTSNVIQNADGSTKTVYTVDVNNVKPTAASTEKVQAKADVAGSSDKNIAKVSPKVGDQFGEAGATYEVNVSRNDVKDAAREAVTVNTTNTTNNPITVTPVQDEANHNTTYQVTFDGDKAAKQIPLTYKANGQNAQTVTLDKGLNFTNGKNTTASVDAEGVVKYDVNKDLVDIHSISNTTNGPKMEFGPNSINITNGPINMGDQNITNLKSGGDVINNAANIGDVTRISKANDLHIAPTSSNRQGETTTSYAYDAASKSVTLKYNDGNGANQSGTVAKIDLSGLADQIKDGYSFSTDAKGNVVGNHAVTPVANGKTVSYAAGKNLTVAQNIDNATGEHTYTYALSNDVDLTPNGSLKIGDTILNNGGLTITGGPSVTKTGINAGNLNITNVKAGVNDTDAVNVKQLKDARTVVTSNDNSVTVNKTENGNQVTYDLHVAPGAAQSVWNVKSTGNTTADSETTAKTISDGKTVEMAAGKNLTVKQTSNNDGAKVEFDLANDIKIGKDGRDGVDGKIGVNGKDGSSVVINGKDGSIGLNGKDGKDGLTMKGEKGQPGLNGKDGITRIVYEDNNHDKHEVATLDDGLNFTGNNTDTVNKQKLNSLVKVQGEGVDKNTSATFKSAAGNINVKADGTDTLEVQLNKDLKNINTIKNGGNATFTIGGDNFAFNGGNVSLGGNNITNLKSGIVNNNSTDDTNGANIGDVKTISKANDLHIAPTTSDRTGETTTSYAYDTASKSVTLKYNDGNGANQAGTIAKIDLSGLADQIKDGYSFSTDAKGNVVGNHAVTAVGNGKTVSYAAGDNLTVKQDIDATTGEHTYTYALSNDIKVGKDGKDGIDGKIGVNGKDGSSVVINGKDGSIGLNGKDGKDGLTIRGEKGQDGVDGKNGTNGITRIVYEDHNNDKHEVATLDDGMKYAGDDAQGTDKSKVIAKKLNETMDVVGGADKSKLTDNNIGVNNVDGKLKVQLSKEVNLTPSGSLTIGDTVVNNSGLTISGGPSIIKTGINASNLNITNVKAGVNDTDAVNVKQLKDARTVVTSNDNSVTVNKTENGNQVTYDLHVAPGAAQSVWNVKSTGNTTADSETTAKTISDGKTVEMAAGKNLTVKQTSNNDGAKVEFDLANDIKIGKDGRDGVDGKIGVNGKDGSSVVINGKDGSIGLNGKDGKDGLTMKGEKGADGVTRIVYEDHDNNKHEVATLDDGLRFDANSGGEKKNKLGSKVTVKGTGAKADSEYDSSNIKTSITQGADGNSEINIGLAKDLNNINTIKNGGPATFTIGGNEFKFDGGNVNMGGNNITNLKSGIVNNNSTDDTNGANIGDVKTISKANDLHIAPTTSDRTGETTTSYAYDTASKSVTLKYNDGNGANQAGTIAKIDLSGLADQIKDGYSFSTDAKGNVVGNHAVTAVGNGKTVSYAAGDNLTIAQNIDNATGEQTYTYALSNDIKVGKDGKDGVDGKIGVNGKDGSSVVINGKDGSIGLNGKDGKDGLTIRGEKGQDGVDGKNGTNGITRIVYEDHNNDKHEVATLDDGMKYAGDDAQGTDKSKVIAKKLNETMDVVGGADKSKLTDNNIGVNNVDGKLKVQLSKEVNLTPSGSLTIGDTVVNNNGLTISGGPSIIKTGINAGNLNITNVKAGVNDTDAVNVKQLKDARTVVTSNDNSVTVNKTENGNQVTYDLHVAPGAAQSVWNVKSTGNTTADSETTAKTISDGKTVEMAAGKNLTVKQTSNNDGAKVEFDLANDIKIGKDGRDGVDGKIGVNGKDGSSVVINGKDGSIGLNGKDGKDGLTMKGEKGQPGLNGKDGITRIVYEDNNHDKHEVATLDDGLNFTGNNTDTVNKQKLNSLVKVQGEGVDKNTSAAFKSAAGNINVKADGTDTLEVQLNKDLNNINTIKNGGPATFTIGGNEFKFDGGNVNMGGNNITNLKSGIVNNNSTDDTNGANIGDVKTISKANDLHIAPTTSDRTGETTTSYAYDTASKSVTLKYNDGNGANQAGTIAKIDLSGLADQIKDGYSFSTDAKGNVVGNHAVTAVGNGKTVSYAAGDNLTVKQDIDATTGEHTYTYALSNDIKVGKDGKDGIDGKIGVNGKDGSSVVINGKDGSIGLNGKDGKDGLTMKGEKGADGVTRIVYEDHDNNKHEVATLDDGLRFDANSGGEKKNKLGSKVTVKGTGAKADSEYDSSNIKTSITQGADGNSEINIGLAKDLNNINTIKNGGPATFTIGGNEFKFDGGNVNMGGNNITNLKSGIVNNNSTDDTNGANIGDVKTISKANDIHVKDTRYTVNADKTVTLEYVDGNDKKINKTAVIDLSNLPTGGNAITYKANNQNAQTVSLDKGLNFMDGNYTKASVDADGIVKYDVTIGKVKDGVDGKPGVDGNDGIATVKTVVDTINNSGWKGDVTGNTVGNHTATIVKPGTTVNFGAGKNVTVEQIVNAVTGDHTYNYALSDDIKLGKDGKDGVDGRIGVNGKDGSSVVINGKDGSIGLNGKDGKDGLTMKAENGQPGLNGKDGITRIVYEDKNNNKHEVATLDDGLRFTGNNEVENKQKLGSLVKIKGEGVSKDEEARFASAAGNIAVTADGTDTLTVRLNKNIKGIDSIQTKEIHLGTPDNYTTIKKDGDRIKYGDKTIANTDELWTIQANGTDVPANGGKVNVKGADGITVSRTANGEMTISGSGLGTMNSFNVKSTGNTAAGSETAAKKITDGKTVEFSGGNNVTVKQTSSDDGAKVEFALKNNIDLTQDGSVKIGDTKITDGGLVINNGPSITKDGINAGNKQITNVEDGVNDTDAVNVRQLKDAKTKLVDGQNTTVTGDGSKANPYKVNVEGDLNKITSITNKEGDGKLEFKGDQVVNVAGDNTIKLDGKTGDITGLTNKTLDSADFATKGRAATEEQLKLVQQEAAKKSTEKVQAKADDNNIAKVAPKAGDTFGAAGATYEVSVDKNDVKDVAREAVTVSGDKKAITVDVQPNATNHTTNYQVNFNGKEAAKQIPLTYKENGGNARTVMLSDGLDFTNGVNTTAHTAANGKVSFDVKGDLTNITSISNNSNGPKMSFGGDSINITGGSLNMGDNYIHNVKAGEKNTDAVNVSQLKAAKTEVEAGRNVTVEHRLGENGQDIYKVNAEAGVDPRVDKLGEEIGHVGAQSAALSALKPIQYDPMEPTQIMAGYGNYRGNSALALGVAHYKNESTMFHAGVSWAGGNGHMMANAGVTWKVGNRDSEAAVADRYRKGPISSTYAMQTEVASMKAQNAGLKGEVSDLKAENEQIKAQNAGLQSEVDQLKAQMAAMMAKLGM